MKIQISEKLSAAARKFPSPLYLVGGFVRNSLLGVTVSDQDVASACSAERAAALFAEQGWTVTAVYPRMGTVKLCAPETGEEVEYTQFRTERYAPGGGHTPRDVLFTREIGEDARRRDFSVNAIYCDAATGELADPCGGLVDLEKREIRTADLPERVFGSDGLRLLRLVRFCAELGFSPEPNTFAAARACRDNLDDIAEERIADEFRKICFADLKYPALTEESRTPAHAAGLRMLDELGLLEKILPEITAGKGIAQRADYHRYDVFGHTMETFRLSPPEVRIAALLHDVGKPICYRETGRFYGHEEVGAIPAYRIAMRAFGCSKREASEISALVRLHMYDLAGVTRENKLKKFLAEHSALVPKLLLLKQADYLGGGLLEGECPTVTRWKALLRRMDELGTPRSLADLKIDGRDVLAVLPELPKNRISTVLRALFEECVCNESLNDRDKLLARLEKFGRE